MRKLTQSEIKEIKKIEGVNNRKNYIQKLMIDEWWKTKVGLIQAFTGFGKAYLISLLIQKINKEYPDYTITIISPFTKLKEDFEDRIVQFGLKNTISTTIQSYSREIKNGENKKTSILIIDEAHTCSNEDSRFFSSTIPKTEYNAILCVSATVEQNNLKFFQKQGIDLIFDLPIETGFQLELIPSFEIFCIGVSLTEKEKLEYIKIQKTYDSLISFFSQYNINNPVSVAIGVSKGKNIIKYQGEDMTGNELAERVGNALDLKAGSVVGTSMRWMKCINQRTTLLNHSENLIKGSLYILKKIKEKTIVFCSSKENVKYMLSQLPNSVAYHSGISDKKRKENLKEFEEGNAQYLLSIKGLDAGWDYEKIKVGLQYNYSSKKLQFSQRHGRLNRFNINDLEKHSIFICLYIENFIVDDVVQLSPQKKWLQSSLRGRSFVTWCDSINDLKLN